MLCRMAEWKFAGTSIISEKYIQQSELLSLIHAHIELTSLLTQASLIRLPVAPSLWLALEWDGDDCWVPWPWHAHFDAVLPVTNCEGRWQPYNWLARMAYCSCSLFPGKGILATFVMGTSYLAPPAVQKQARSSIVEHLPFLYNLHQQHI